MCVMSRAEYDEHRVRTHMQAGMGEDEARKHHEASYPRSTDMVIFELQARGLAATDWRMQRMVRDPNLRPREVSGTFCWTKKDVDRVAGRMLELGMLAISAMYRQELGITWTQEQELRRAKAEKEAGNA
jgi:hypothetical protein